jgi:hypothetical protein
MREYEVEPAAYERAAYQRGGRVLMRSREFDQKPTAERRWVFCFNF